MADDETFTRLIAALRAGEDAAARQVFERFAVRLLGLARTRMNRMLARKADPEDVVQSAFKSFFFRHREGQLDAGGWEGLWSLLTLITVRKCADRAEYHFAERRDVAREVFASTVGEGPDPCLMALDREPRPEEALILAETVEQLFCEVSAHERPILEMSLQGYTVSEISVRLGRAERSVRRLRERIRKRLERVPEVD